MTTVEDAPRALPGMNGALHADRPVVEQVIDDSAGYNVTVDVTGQVDLLALFRAIAGDVRLREAARILMHNQGRTLTGRGLLLEAARDFRSNPDVRRAFTLTLGPSQAEDLGEDLSDAAIAPLIQPLSASPWDGVGDHRTG